MARFCPSARRRQVRIAQVTGSPLLTTAAAKEDIALEEISPHLEQHLGLSTAKVHVLPDRLG